MILQGHLDMVCEKEPDCAKDMDAEGLDLFVDGDVIGAKGTTLGSDDGIAVAMALAALEDEDPVPSPAGGGADHRGGDRNAGRGGAGCVAFAGPHHAEY